MEALTVAGALTGLGGGERGSIWTIPMSVYWDPTDAIHYLKLEVHSWATNWHLESQAITN